MSRKKDSIDLRVDAKDNRAFKKFIQHTSAEVKADGAKYGVIYTRVSSKEQFDKNGSLETQRKMCETLASNYNIDVIETFGGTYESAKTEERAEFQRMMKFINSSKRQIRYILVSDSDRFSRTGGNAIFLASNLRKRGIQILAASSPVDTLNTSGAFQQDIQLLFSYYDNMQRREKTIRGMLQKYQNGIFFGKPPLGYDVVVTNSQNTFVINHDGKLLAKAFKWKAEKKLPNYVIGLKLRTLGVKVTDKRLSALFRNVFYCGLLSNRMLGNEIVDGKNWPALVSKDIFLKANNVLDNAYVKYESRLEDVNLPLKQVIKCDKCSTPMTGYIVRKKGIYYYKCNTVGCGSNKSAKHMNGKFYEFLAQFQVSPTLHPLIKKQLIATVRDTITEKISETTDWQKRASELNSKIQRLEERFLAEDIDKDFYQKYREQHKTELNSILEKSHKTQNKLSNLENVLKTYFERSQNINKIWESGNITDKQQLVNSLFKGEIYYNVQNDTYRTTHVNPIITYFALGSSIMGPPKNENAQLLAEHSPLVAPTRIELISKV